MFYNCTKFHPNLWWWASWPEWCDPITFNHNNSRKYFYFEFQEPDWGADDGWLSGIGELWASGVSDLGDEFNLETGDSKWKMEGERLFKTGYLFYSYQFK